MEAQTGYRSLSQRPAAVSTSSSPASSPAKSQRAPPLMLVPDVSSRMPPPSPMRVVSSSSAARPRTVGSTRGPSAKPAASLVSPIAGEDDPSLRKSSVNRSSMAAAADLEQAVELNCGTPAGRASAQPSRRALRAPTLQHAGLKENVDLQPQRNTPLPERSVMGEALASSVAAGVASTLDTQLAGESTEKKVLRESMPSYRPHPTKFTGTVGEELRKGHGDVPTPTMSVGSEAVAASLTPEVRSASEAAPSFGVASSRTKTLRELMRFVDGSVGRATSPRRQDSVSVVGADAGGYGGAGVAKETITQEALRKAASAEAAAQAAAVPMAGTRVERPMGRATSPRILPARSPYADLTAAEAAAISAAAPRRPTSCRPTAVQLGDATAYPADATFKTMAQRVFAEHQSPLDAPRLAALAANKQRTQSAAASALLAPEYTATAGPLPGEDSPRVGLRTGYTMSGRTDVFAVKDDGSAERSASARRAAAVPVAKLGREMAASLRFDAEPKNVTLHRTRGAAPADVRRGTVAGGSIADLVVGAGDVSTQLTGGRRGRAASPAQTRPLFEAPDVFTLTGQVAAQRAQSYSYKTGSSARQGVGVGGALGVTTAAEPSAAYGRKLVTDRRPDSIVLG